jgi:mRNA interferase MazF
MAIQFHPEPGTILICNFEGLKSPEMVKRRPVVVLSPRFKNRSGLCTVVPMSTTEPEKIQSYHHKLHTAPPLPEPFSSPSHWVKADMIYTVSFARLSLLFSKKDDGGKRIYDQRVIDAADLLKIRAAVLHGIGLTHLTDYL